MLHIKFQDYRTLGSGEMILKAFVIYWLGNHLFHVIFTNICPLFPRRLHNKFGFDWPSGFREDVSK